MEKTYIILNLESLRHPYIEHDNNEPMKFATFKEATTAAREVCNGNPYKVVGYV